MNEFNIFNIPLDNVILVEASAGTGKTFNISSLILRLLVERELQLKNILIVTFTNEAVQDLYYKIQNRLKKALDYLNNNCNSQDDEFIKQYFDSRKNKSDIDKLILKQAYYSIDEAPIYTIHSFCNKIISEFAFECKTNLTLNLVSDDSKIKDLVIKDTIRFFYYDNTKESFNEWNDYKKLGDLYYLIKNYINLDINNIQDQKLQDFIKNILSYIKERLNKLKNKKNIIFFDDLIHLLKNALSLDNGNLIKIIKDKYKVAIIDEFQDTDFNQYYIFKRIYENSSLFLIGDPKQAIYSFRGADIFAYLTAKKDIDTKQQFTLNTNWRSQPNLINAINKLYQDQNPFLFKEINYVLIKASNENNYDSLKINAQIIKPLQLIFINRNDTNVSKKIGDFHITKKWIENNIPIIFSKIIVNLINLGKLNKATINGKPITNKDIAVIVRNHKQAKLMQASLKKYNINSLMLLKDSIFSSNEAINLLYLLNAIIDPFDKLNIYTTLMTDIFDFSLSEIYKILNNESDYQKFVEMLHELNQIWLKKGFLVMFYKFLFSFNLQKRLLTKEDGDRIITNYIHLSELLATKYNELKNQRALLRWLSDKIENKTPETDEEILRLENDEDAVKILTIHKSKGLEFPIVLIPFSLITDYTDIKDNTIISIHDRDTYNLIHYLNYGDSKSNDNEKQYLNELLAEELRLFYVAVTRAKYLCYFSYGITSKKLNSVLDYLLLPDNIKQQFTTTPPLTDQSLKDCILEKFTNDYIDIIDYEQILDKKTIITNCVDITEYKCKFFKKQINNSYIITSYSDLTKQESISEDQIELSRVINYKNNKYLNTKQFYSYTHSDLSHGTDFGYIFHKILENINFNNITFEYLKEKIYSLNITTNLNQDVKNKLVELTWNTLNATLDSSINLKLININDSERISEFEFYLHQDNKLIKEYLQNNLIKEEINDMLKNNFSFDNTDLYIHGFIDLFFKYHEKYYIVDFKTNYLGENLIDYSINKLEEIIKQHHYDLQLLIYVLAVDKYLKKTIENYNYDTHFGGAYLLFVRGLSPENNYGIYYAKPKIS